MKPYIFRGSHRNFGDELGIFLWDRLIPELKNAGEGYLLGIGTLLDSRLTKERPLIVFGTGAGYGPPPDLTGVEVRFVRGPLTAKLLEMPYSYITDPGILTADFKPEAIQRDVSFMPRWTTITNDPTAEKRLEEICIHLIDPRNPVEVVLDEIASSKLVITEALHGAVVADAFRIPWIPVILEEAHTYKWFDWCGSMSLQYRPTDLRVVSVAWARDHGERFLSDLAVHHYKLGSMKRALDDLRYDLELGELR